MTFSAEDDYKSSRLTRHGRLLMIVFIETGRHVGNQLLGVGRSF